MPSTPSPNLRLELQAGGENDSTWGDIANTVFQLLEDALTKRVNLTLSGSDITLTALNYASDQARSLCLNLSGTLTANVNVIVPAVSHMYLVTNNTSGTFTVTVKTASGTGVSVTGAGITLVYCDGTNVVGMTDPSAAFAKLGERNSYTRGNADVPDDYADAATITFNCAESNFCRTVLGGNRAVAFSNPLNGSWLELYFVQDATGSRTVTWPANVLWCGGQPPVFGSAPNAVDKVFLRYHLATDKWLGEVTSAGSQIGGSTINITQQNSDIAVDLFTRAGRPAGVVTVNYTVAAGVSIRALNEREPALSLAGFANGSTINIVNNGYILGAGGSGGSGSTTACAGGGSDRTMHHQNATAGAAGGHAIRGAGAGVTVNITNASGFIWGGGGGGGGGGSTGNSSASNSNAVGGGGGGGAGGAGGGEPGRMVSAGGNTTSGNAGTGSAGGVASTAGTGGAAAQAGGDATGGAGGAGGDWGTAGTAGASPTAGSNDVAGGAAGAAGKAVDPNSSTINILSGSGSPNIKGAIV
jgi:hypothetical protein